MMRQRYVLRCTCCGHRWKTTATRPPTKCPNLDCGVAVETRGIDLSVPKAPAQIGQNNYVKAADQTAEMVMQDYKLTNMKGGSNSLRVGDTVIPPLPPAMQEKADNFFGGGKKSGVSFDSAKAMQTAMAGAATAPLSPTIRSLHQQRYATSVREVANYNPKYRTVAGTG